MTDCPTCRAQERTIAILEKQLEAKDAQIARLLQEAPQIALTAPQSDGKGTDPGVGQVVSEEQRRREMADFIDDQGQPCLVIDGVKVRVDEYQRTMARLDMELSGGRLF